MKLILVVFLTMIISVDVGADACPSGYITIDNPYVTISETCSGDSVVVGMADVCKGTGAVECWLVRLACGAGITQIKTSAGVDFPLYATRSTTPSLCVNYNNTTCYVDLESGGATGAINVNYNGVVYHTISN